MHPKSYKKRPQKKSLESIKHDFVEHFRDVLICDSISGSLSSKFIVETETDSYGEHVKKYKNGYFNKYALPPLKIKGDTKYPEKNYPSEKNIIQSYFNCKKRKLANPTLVYDIHTSLFCEQLQKYGSVNYFRESNNIGSHHFPSRREDIDMYQPSSDLLFSATLVNKEPETPNILHYLSSIEEHDQIFELKRNSKEKRTRNQNNEAFNTWLRRRKKEWRLQRAIRIVSLTEVISK